MFRHQKLTQLFCAWVTAAVFVVITVMGPGCSTQQNQNTPETQGPNLPTVGSLDDYVAQSSNDYPYMYASYGSCDPFMIDPFWCAPS